MEVPINAIKERQKQELLTRMSSDPHMREAEFEIVSNHLTKDGNLGVYGAKANNYVGFGGGHSSGKPPRHRG